uniref:Melanotransferrin n=1 Tax=Stichopus japonicus TaxID=307972 RepID=E3VVT7_STIJA|nr:melanotransferrin [Apostichopus japonicus]
MIRLCLAFLFLCGAWAHEASSPEPPARWCTISAAEYAKCLSMSQVFADNHLSPTVHCIERPTVEECLITIREGGADLITLDGGDVFRAGKVFGMKPIMKERYSGGSTGYYGIAVTRATYTNVSLTNLKGARSCHTGVGRTAGWNIPVGYLLHSGQMKSEGCKEHVKSAAKFFNASCAPGTRLAINNPYNDDVDNLCNICSGDCGRDADTEPYNGYSGALRCLVEGRGEVAFVKPATLEANLGENAPDWAAGVTADDLRLLCKDGSQAPISDAANCHISSGVSHSVMTSGTASSEVIESYQRLLESATNLFSGDDNEEFTMFDSSAWDGRNLIFKDYTESMADVEVENYAEYLGGYGESFEGLQKCPENTIRFCTISEQEQQKCRAMRDAFSAAGLLPEISCYPAANHADCIDSIVAGLADIVTLDGGDIYRAGKDHGLKVILGEVYNYNQPGSYWSVAVVHAGTSFNIHQLEGKRSCHTGIMKTSGWVMPVGFLATNEYIDTTGGNDGCDVTAAVGNFFNSSCVPGAKSRDYDVYGTNPPQLCTNCVGKDEDFCARNSHEPYYDYSGAFRCLVENAGDVAFVKHSTVEENTKPNGKDEWNSYLRKKNFELLCPDGTRKSSWKGRQCNLGQVPSHAVVTSGEKKDDEIAQIITLLSAGVGQFGHPVGSGFKMFNSTGYIDNEGQTGKNLLFKDSTINLKSIPSSKRNYDAYLGISYVNALETIKCERN